MDDFDIFSTAAARMLVSPWAVGPALQLPAYGGRVAAQRLSTSSRGQHLDLLQCPRLFPV
jgi:hypothetical protein